MTHQRVVRLRLGPPPTSLHLQRFSAEYAINPRTSGPICISRGTRDSEFEPHREDFPVLVSVSDLAGAARKPGHTGPAGASSSISAARSVPAFGLGPPRASPPPPAATTSYSTIYYQAGNPSFFRSLLGADGAAARLKFAVFHRVSSTGGLSARNNTDRHNRGPLPVTATVAPSCPKAGREFPLSPRDQGRSHPNPARFCDSASPRTNHEVRRTREG